jgi:hypothetical protein
MNIAMTRRYGRGAIDLPAVVLLYDWSPIEPCWSKIKTALRGMKARMRAALDDALANVIRKISNSEARGWFRHCGYSIH